LVLKVFNRMTRKLEMFEPFNNGRVGMYVCGLTVQDYAHIGHARTYVAFDVIRRYLKFRGYDVVYIQNTTDVEDKIITRAHELGVDPLNLASEFTAEGLKDLDALGIERANAYPRVTEHLADIIELIEKLVRRGYAYQVDGDIYFSIDEFPDYGALSHQSPSEVMAGARVEVDHRKRNPVDFALWKKAKLGELSFDSPWGRGRPGWHIECSALAMKYIGEQIEIHGGGTDLIFPHHENEIAQSEAATGKKPFVKYWLHTGLLNINGEKMSKSLGNFIRVRDLVKKWHPDAFRLYIISTHYSTPIEFSERALDNASSMLAGIKNTVGQLETSVSETSRKNRDVSTSAQHNQETREIETVRAELTRIRNRFVNTMDNDFNSPQALVVFRDLLKFANKTLGSNASPSGLELILRTIKELAAVFGLSSISKAQTASQEDLPEDVATLIKKREEARRRRRWEEADEIREKLEKIGYVLEDSSEGTKWKRKPV